MKYATVRVPPGDAHFVRSRLCDDGGSHVFPRMLLFMRHTCFRSLSLHLHDFPLFLCMRFYFPLSCRYCLDLAMMSV